MFYSLIIPVHNRPDHIEKLLGCLAVQTFTDFDVNVIEDGSTRKADLIIDQFSDKLQITYLETPGLGQGFARNEGMKIAKGDFFVILDSDIVLEPGYMKAVNDGIQTQKLDCFGGPDALHPDSTDFQKAADFCMTSFLTTGGTRGGSKAVGKFYPRSFNMGISRKVFEVTKGFKIPFLGEDIEFSQRVMANKFKTGLIPEVVVYHERKRTPRLFYNQIHFFGRARINIAQLIPGSFKATHLLPLVFMAYLLLIVSGIFISPNYALWIALPYLLYNFLIFVSSFFTHKNLITSCWSVLMANALMIAYATGMIQEYWKLYILKKEQTYP